jgi:putative PIN family toxin of toxin-antitoxin system
LDLQRGPSAQDSPENAESGKIQLYVSPPILHEVRSVLTRKSIRHKFPNLTPELVDEFVQKLASVAMLRTDVPSAGVRLRDPNDLAYLDLAIAVDARYLVTRDKDLLNLMKQASFVTAYRQLHIVEPVSFLESVRSS